MVHVLTLWINSSPDGKTGNTLYFSQGSVLIAYLFDKQTRIYMKKKVLGKNTRYTKCI